MHQLVHTPAVASGRDDAKLRRRAAGLFPSRDVDVATALELFSWNHYRFARSTESFTEEAIRPVLAALVKARPDDPAVIFLQSALDERDLVRSWKDAVNALKIFGSLYAWGSKPKREKLGAIAKKPRLLAATQAAASTGKPVPDEYLAVLVLDGSDESVDALLPHFDRAMKDPARLDALERLRTYARRTPALDALLTRVDAKLAERTKTSPVLLLARRLGIARGDRFRVDVQLQGARRAHFAVSLDSDAPRHFLVRLQAGQVDERTSFDGDALRHDTLGLGACTLEELPAWLTRAERKLGLTLDRDAARATHLRGQRLTTFLAWLLG